jgi:hypothetical protein
LIREVVYQYYDGTSQYGSKGDLRTASVKDTDGNVLYDRDATEIGTNTFTSGHYAGNRELLAIAERMRTESEGSGSYTLAAEGSSTPVRKEVAWTSVGLHGTEWRVVASTATAPS